MIANNLKNIRLLIVLGIIFLMNSCVEKYWPEINTNSDRFIVVDGKISNLPGPYTVKLSYSSSTIDSLFIPISSAKVTIDDDLGNIEELREEKPGYYKSRAGGIQGIIGRSYKIKIRLDNGETYESEFEQILSPIEVEDLLVQEEWQYAQNVLEDDHEGLKFYVKTRGALTTNAYFLWEIEETYEYHSAEPIFYFYDGSNSSEGPENNFGLQNVTDMYSLYYCWKTEPLSENFSHSIENLNIQETHKIPLHFIPYGDKRLRFGYNILLKQYIVSEKAYTFLNELEKQNENQGGLFTSQPFQIRGNIFNTNNTSEPVLGYFMVASGSYGPRIQVKAPWRSYEKPICNAHSSSSTINHILTNSTAEDWPIYFTYFPHENPLKPDEFFMIFSYVTQSCLDCTKLGGTTNKPDFWQELDKSQESPEIKIK